MLFFKALSVLFFILILLVGCLYLLKRYLPLSTKKSLGIQLIDQLVLSNKERIVIVDVEEVKLIIGISQHTFSTLYIVEKNAK